MDRAGAEAWIAAYVRLWRAGAGAASDLGTLFTEDATYRTAPSAAPLAGLPAIAAWWGAETDPAERWELAAEVVAVEGEVAVARLDVRYSAPEPVRYRDLWIIRFAPDGRCAAFEEWWWREEPSPVT